MTQGKLTREHRKALEPIACAVLGGFLLATTCMSAFIKHDGQWPHFLIQGVFWVGFAVWRRLAEIRAAIEGDCK